MKRDEYDGMQRIGKWIRELRKATGFTQAELGYLLDSNQGVISRLERGERVPMAIVFRVLAAFGRTPNEVASYAGWWTVPPNGGAALEYRPQM
jgi:transcriptional regulator with XRE-family HTH domain